MSWIVQQPHSQTNQTDQYRVVDADEWMHYANGTTRLLAIGGSFATYADAQQRCTEWNDLS